MPHVRWVPRVEGEDEIVVAVTAVVEQFLGASGGGGCLLPPKVGKPKVADSH